MKKFFVILLIMVLMLPITVAKATDNNEITLGKMAKSVVLMEASTGKIIYERNANEKLHPASMTKMMSMLLILESIEKGNLKWNDMITVSENASSMGGSQILLETGEQMSVDDLFKGIAIASGNDAVVALAEKVAGTEEVFVKMMNDKAKESAHPSPLSAYNGFFGCNHFVKANEYLVSKGVKPINWRDL